MRLGLIRKLLAGAMAFGMLFSVTAHAGETEIEEKAEAVEEAALPAEENYRTGDASLDDPLNQDDIGEREILVVSFGTSNNYSRCAAIGAIERDIAAAFPDWSVRRAFAADSVIDHIAQRDGELIDSVPAALQRAADNGVKKLVIVPTHLTEGSGYKELTDALAGYADTFGAVSAARPLFGGNESPELAPVIEIITGIMTNYDDGKTAVVYAANGTGSESDADFAALQDALTEAGYTDYYILAEGSESRNADQVLREMDGKGYTKAVLRPLMVTVGENAEIDMAGTEEGSLRTRFKNAGYETDCILEGLGQIAEIRQIYVQRAQEAVSAAG